MEVTARARSMDAAQEGLKKIMSAPFTKISVNLSNEIINTLREMAARDNVTMTEVLRRAISTQKFLEDAQADGKSILLRDESTKETERLIFR